MPMLGGLVQVGEAAHMPHRMLEGSGATMSPRCADPSAHSTSFPPHSFSYIQPASAITSLSLTLHVLRERRPAEHVLNRDSLTPEAAMWRGEAVAPLSDHAPSSWTCRRSASRLAHLTLASS